MPTPSTSDLPKPKDWNEFEDMVWDLYTRRWEDPSAQRYGRSGQAQHGVDIYGRKNGTTHFCAVQCKRYDDGKLTSAIIAEEVAKADTFSSEIGEYVIATTALRDTKIQDYVREINETRRQNNKFPISVVFWEDLCRDLTQPGNSDLLKKHYASSWANVFDQKAAPKQQQDHEKLFQAEVENIVREVPQPILESPHWKISFSPQTYENQLLRSRNDCRKLIEDNTIKVSGYSYPRRYGNERTGSTWVGIETDLERHEYWRFYQSGQFVNFSSFWRHDSKDTIADGEIIYTLTSIFEFLSHLSQNTDYSGVITVSIELHNVQDVGLTLHSDLTESSCQHRKATSNSYQKSWSISLDDSEIDWEEKAIEAIIWFAECFSPQLVDAAELFKKQRQDLLSS